MRHLINNNIKYSLHFYLFKNENYRTSLRSMNTIENGFDRGQKIEKIIGLKPPYKGKLLFIVKWENIKETEEVESTIMNIKVPQLVLEFYQNNIKWTDEYPIHVQIKLKKHIKVYHAQVTTNK